VPPQPLKPGYGPESVVFNEGEFAPQGAILYVMGAILWFTRFEGDFSFQGGDFNRLEYSKTLSLFQN